MVLTAFNFEHEKINVHSSLASHIKLFQLAQYTSLLRLLLVNDFTWMLSKMIFFQFPHICLGEMESEVPYWNHGVKTWAQSTQKSIRRGLS